MMDAIEAIRDYAVAYDQFILFWSLIKNARCFGFKA